jgi:segregation and condensation protein B
MLENIITILFLSGEPVTIAYIARMCDMTPEDVTKMIPVLDAHLASLGLQTLVNKDEVSMVTLASQAPLVEKFWKDELRGDLTPAALQVLTLVAYLGNPTRQDISFIRGIQSNQSIRSLTVRGLVELQGEICTLTGESLKHLGIKSIHELPDYVNLNKELLEKLASARQE